MYYTGRDVISIADVDIKNRRSADRLTANGGKKGRLLNIIVSEVRAPGSSYRHCLCVGRSLCTPTHIILLCARYINTLNAFKEYIITVALFCVCVCVCGERVAISEWSGGVSVERGSGEHINRRLNFPSSDWRYANDIICKTVCNNYPRDRYLAFTRVEC